MTFTIMIPSNCEAKECMGKLSMYPAILKDGKGYKSFSKLINDCIVDCKTNILVISNYKARPSPDNVNKLLNLIEAGYGVVGLYRFGFFGFKLDLIHKIGFFDERYISGGYEDCDIVRRLKESDIAYYETEEVEYHHAASRWNNKLAKKHFKNKWYEDSTSLKRLLPEERYEYKLCVPNTNSYFLPFSRSVFLNKHDEFINKKIIK